MNTYQIVNITQTIAEVEQAVRKVKMQLNEFKLKK